jgi:hypothetical protein
MTIWGIIETQQTISEVILSSKSECRVDCQSLWENYGLSVHNVFFGNQLQNTHFSGVFKN